MQMQSSNRRRSLLVALTAALIVTVAAVYIATAAGGRREQPTLTTVDCLRVERGPMLTFEGGLLNAAGTVVGRYSFLPAVPGKHGPRIGVEGIRVREVGEQIRVEPGTEAWFWPFRGDNAVEIFFYPQNSTVARRCAA